MQLFTNQFHTGWRKYLCRLKKSCTEFCDFKIHVTKWITRLISDQIALLVESWLWWWCFVPGFRSLPLNPFLSFTIWKFVIIHVLFTLKNIWPYQEYKLYELSKIRAIFLQLVKKRRHNPSLQRKWSQLLMMIMMMTMETNLFLLHQVRNKNNLRLLELLFSNVRVNWP